MPVYFIRCQLTQLVKIGYADFPLTRLNTLQTGSPGELRLEAVVHREPAYERKLHARFGARRVRGEWFRLTQEEVAAIAEHTVEGPGPEPERPHGFNVAPKDYVVARLVSDLQRELDRWTPLCSCGAHPRFDASMLEHTLADYLKHHRRMEASHEAVCEEYKRDHAKWVAAQAAYAAKISTK